MAGFFGLFSKKPKYIDEITESDNLSSESSAAFFLNPDEAKTLGDIKLLGKSNNQKPEPQSEPQSNPPVESESIERRRNDNSMDMFRQMARDIKK